MSRSRRRLLRRDIGDHSETIRTFDVFDTLMTRAVGRPSDVFLLLGRVLADAGWLSSRSPHAFAGARIAADRRAHANGGGREAGVGLREIWQELCHALDLPAEHIDAFVAEELAVEARVLRGVDPVVEVLRRARSSGRVALLSDTYLSVEQLVGLLRGCGIELTPEEVFTSRDARAVKGTGRLFEVAAAALHVRPEQLVHLGDDQHADIRGAQKAKVKAQYVGLGRNTRYEVLLGDHGARSDGLASALAGAARLARIRSEPVPKDLAPVVEVSAGVAAPIVLAYAMWLLQRATDEGVDRVYFLARDGQVVYEVCRRIGPSLGWPVDRLRYLRCSRVALTAPLLIDDSGSASAWAWTHLEHASAAEVLDRVGGDVEAMAGELDRLGIDDASLPLDERQREVLLASLADGPAADAMNARVTQQRGLVHDYLAQEGFLDDMSVATVDLGGRGSQFQALALARQQAGVGPPTGFYGYLLRAPEPPLYPDQEHAWLFDQRRNVGSARFPGFVSMLEAFFAADHGSVRAYRATEGRIVADCNDPAGPKAEWASGPMRRAIILAAEELLLDQPLVHPQADVRPAVLEVARRFWLEPTSAEVRAWGGFPFEDGDPVQPLARPASAREAAAFVSGRGWPGAWWEWPAGSIELAPRWVRAWRLIDARPARRPLHARLAGRMRNLVAAAAGLAGRRRSTTPI